MDEKELVRRGTDLEATYARFRSRIPASAARQEELLDDARAWAAEEAAGLLSDTIDVSDLKRRLVKRTFDWFLPRHPYFPDFRLGYAEFASALCDEKWPSIADRAIEAMRAREQERAADVSPGPQPASAPTTPEATPAAGAPVNEDESPPVRSKRGRPVKISREQKEAARSARAAGKSWRAVAVIFYGRYPTPQQVKNAPNVLKNYLRALERAEQKKQI
jgi:hypothetical protein